MSRFTTRADGANHCMFDLNAHLGLVDPKPLFFPGWDTPTESSKLLAGQLGGVNLKPFASDIRMVGMALYTGTPVCLVGPQGCGKSTLLKALLAMTNWDIVITQASETAEMIDLMGIRMPDGSWIENGPLNAYRAGKVWMVEERDRFSPGTATDLNSMLDRAPLRVPFLGEDAIPHANFSVVGTANTVGNGEGIETFISSQMQTPAANRRWMFLTLGYMDRSEEEKVLMSRCPALTNFTGLATALLNFADATRKQSAFPAFSTAELSMAAEMLHLASPVRLPEILAATYLNKLTSTQRAAAQTLWDNEGGPAMATAFAQQAAATP